MSEQEHRTLFEIRIESILADLEQKANNVTTLKAYKDLQVTVQTAILTTFEAIKQIRELVKAEFAPKPPLTWEDVEHWVTSRKKGTYLTLIREDGTIAKTLRIDPKKEYVSLSVAYLSEDIQIAMKKTIARITLPNGEILDKPIPSHITDARLYYMHNNEAKQGKLT